MLTKKPGHVVVHVSVFIEGAVVPTCYAVQVPEDRVEDVDAAIWAQLEDFEGYEH